VAGEFLLEPRLAKGSNDEAVLAVHDVVAPQVVEHDGVVLVIELRVFVPHYRQRLAVKNA
jgi:hypothetical protein